MGLILIYNINEHHNFILTLDDRVFCRVQNTPDNYSRVQAATSNQL